MSATGATADDEPTTVRHWLILGTCSLATMLYATVVTVANVVLPQMRGTLSATQDQIAWTVTFNLVATAICTPLTGWLAGRFGRRRVMVVGITCFTIASALCGVADSLEALVFYRILQGAFGAPLVPLSQAIILDTFPKSKHGLATAIWGMGVVVGPIIGPTVGGYIAEALSWRGVFFMLVPPGVLALLGALTFITDSPSKRQMRFDWTGFLALSAAVASLQLMLDRGQRLDWFESPEILIEATAAGVALYLFVVHTLTAKAPFLDPRLLADRNYALGLFFALIFGMLNFTPMVLFPPLLQDLRGYPDSVIGLLLAARGVGSILATFLVVPLTRIDPRLALAAGFGLQAYSGWAVTDFDINLTFWGVAWTSALQGFGVGMTWVPLTVIAFSTLEPRYLAEGTAVFHLLRNFGSSVFISLTVALVLRSTRVSYADMAEHVNPFSEAMRAPFAMGNWSADSLAGLARIGGEVQRQAAMIGYLNGFMAFAILGFAVLPFLLLVRLPKRPAS